MSDLGRIASPFRDTPSFKLPDHEAPRLVALSSPFVQAFAFESTSLDAEADDDGDLRLGADRGHLPRHTRVGARARSRHARAGDQVDEPRGTAGERGETIGSTRSQARAERELLELLS